MKGVSAVGEFVTIVGDEAGYVVRGSRSMAFTEETLDDLINTLTRYKDHKEAHERSTHGIWTIDPTGVSEANRTLTIHGRATGEWVSDDDLKDLATLLKRRFPEQA
jgi:hypothetical protein